MKILGISAFYHDSAAALIQDGRILAAVQEERFSRKKYDADFPLQSVNFCLNAANLKITDIDAVVYYDKPWLKFERILETYYAFAPKGAKSFRQGLPKWIKEKAMLPRLLRKHIPESVPLKYSSHHLSHGASAFYPSPFSSAAVITLDGVGEWATSTISHGQGREFKLLKEMSYPHSVGLLYSAFTQFCGFKVNSGEYKLMGLAPYGRKGHAEVKKFKDIILNKLCHIYEDGGIWLDQSYFSYSTDLSMINTKKFETLFGCKARALDSRLDQVYCDLALAIQEVTEEVILKMARHARDLTGEKNLCLAGGVALNCVANGRLKREKIFSDIWVQPAAGDAGGALGSALAYYYSFKENQRVLELPDGMKGSYLGPSFDDLEVMKILEEHNISFTAKTDLEICDAVSELIAEGQVIGWFQGKMEFGPRALGSRSILADARCPDMQKKLNLKIKYREGFRPFAPSCLAEDAKEYFSEGFSSPYMLLVDHIKDEIRNPLPNKYDDLSIDERLYFIRSSLPAITHLDYSARVQTVHREVSPLYHQLLTSFKKRTGYGLVTNTSFNVRGEPIVCDPMDALKCFFQTEMDALALGGLLVEKRNQKPEVVTAFRNLGSAYVAD